jgi:hypothetical protein
MGEVRREEEHLVVVVVGGGGWGGGGGGGVGGVGFLVLVMCLVYVIRCAGQWEELPRGCCAAASEKARICVPGSLLPGSNTVMKGVESSVQDCLHPRKPNQTLTICFGRWL